MALQFIDKKYLAAKLIDVWQTYLDTEKDPVSGKYFTSDPNNGGGLFGSLTDKLADTLEYSTGDCFFTPHQKSKIQTIIDNRNGLIHKGPLKLDVSFSWEDVLTVEHSAATGIKAQISEEILLKGSIGDLGVDSKTNFSIEASHNWANKRTEKRSETKNIKLPVEIDIPAKGKAYQIILTYNEDSLKINYLAKVFLHGTSYACFETPVNGKKFHSLDAGTICELISKYELSKDEPNYFNKVDNSPQTGYIAYRGKINATQSHNFEIKTIDITADLNAADAGKIRSDTI